MDSRRGIFQKDWPRTVSSRDQPILGEFNGTGIPASHYKSKYRYYHSHSGEHRHHLALELLLLQRESVDLSMHWYISRSRRNCSVFKIKFDSFAHIV